MQQGFGHQARLQQAGKEGAQLASEVQRAIREWQPSSPEATIAEVEAACGKLLCALDCLPCASPEMSEVRTISGPYTLYAHQIIAYRQSLWPFLITETKRDLGECLNILPDAINPCRVNLYMAFTVE